MSRRCMILRASRSGASQPFLGEFRPVIESYAAAIPSPTLAIGELSPNEIRDLRRDPDVVGIAPAVPLKLIAPQDVPVPGASSSAWGVDAVGAGASSRDGSGTVVAVLDTGIDAGHPAFAGMTLIERDFTGEGGGDAHGHGTHCAATIFGRDVDGLRIGVARGVQKALIGKVLDRHEAGTTEMLFQALRWAVEEADVVSLSLGFDVQGHVDRLVADRGLPRQVATSQAFVDFAANLRMFDAIMAENRARDSYGLGGAAVVVAAAGNESNSPAYRIASSLPAASEGILAVGALQRGSHAYAIAPFSNTLVDLCAPGVDILSACSGGGLRSRSGTSMAAPHVAGVAALWWQEVRQHSPATSRNVIARLIAASRIAELVNVDVADRGAGLVTAPP